MKDMQGITSSVTKITVAQASCNEITINKLDLSPYKALEEVVVEDNCFKYCTSVVLRGLPALKSLEVGYHSFSFMEYQQIIEFSIARRSASLVLDDCPALSTVRIGRCSFVDYNVCHLNSERRYWA